ncbi:hypothetical protein DPM13_00465 [Paracoccus mutanolyticus]|uniref:Uncharacterized protein n=1 Tax=Paracoccus mutanolyticus TaxID=1499308 RepID=A0ABN5M387_9RHOB|nr:hypothetical protein [Paracoccus mutanolyticus]AWX92283.1 hypothetical protein DPM13_00465 [Paracoccus mutanolyticus]
MHRLRQLREAANDPSVHSVILDIDTGGGEAGGITTVAAQIKALAAQKRVVAESSRGPRAGSCPASCVAGRFWVAARASSSLSFGAGAPPVGRRLSALAEMFVSTTPG